MRRSMHSFTLRSRTLADVGQQEYESIKAALAADSSPAQRECMYNMYTVSALTVSGLQNP